MENTKMTYPVYNCCYMDSCIYNCNNCCCARWEEIQEEENSFKCCAKGYDIRSRKPLNWLLPESDYILLPAKLLFTKTRNKFYKAKILSRRDNRTLVSIDVNGNTIKKDLFNQDISDFCRRVRIFERQEEIDRIEESFI